MEFEKVIPRKKYVANTPIKSDGIRYKVGETLYLADADANPLLASGSVTLVASDFKSMSHAGEISDAEIWRRISARDKAP
jgi:hypothetical protein